MSQIPNVYEIYKHFKGKLYQVLNIAEHSETGEKLVIYQALYGEYKVYARPLETFMEVLDQNKYPDAEQRLRFEPVNREEMHASAQRAVPVIKTDSSKTDAEDDEVIVKEVKEDTEELNIDPMVMKFLDADTYEEKLQILVGLEHRITDEMITTMAVACDVEIPDGSTESRFQGLKNCLLTFDRFECNRLR